MPILCEKQSQIVAGEGTLFRLNGGEEETDPSLFSTTDRY